MISLFSSLLIFQMRHFGIGLPEWIPEDSSRFLKRSLFFGFSLLIASAILLAVFPEAERTEAKLKELSEDELRSVSGQSLLNFTVERGQTDVSGSFSTSTSCGWYCTNNYTYNYRVNNRNGERETHFARIGLDIRLDADQGGFGEAMRIDNLRMGHYWDGSRIGDDNGGYITGGDATDGESFYYGPNFNSFNGCFRQGCSNNDGSTSFDVNSDGLVLGINGNPIEAEGPYLEFAFEDYGSGSPELVGTRIGFEKIRGEASIANISQISTTIRAQDFGDNGNCTAAGHRMSNCPTTLGTNALGLFNIVAFGNNGSSWGDNDGWTEDFWISFNKKDLFWDHQNPEAGTGNASEARFHTDGEGFWIHATDDVEGGVS